MRIIQSASLCKMIDCAVVPFARRDAPGKCKEYYISVDGQLDVKEAARIAGDSKFLGFLGAPFPSAYRLRRAGIAVYVRYSEFEPLNKSFDKFIVDPLASWGVDEYEKLISNVDSSHELLIVCPSIHGHMIDGGVAEMAMKYVVVKGVITKMGDVVKEVIDAHGRTQQM